MPAVRILVLSLLTLMAVLTAGGCWGSRETDEVAYILSIGLDRGEQDRFLVTISIANPQNIAGAGAGGAVEGGLGSSVIMSVESSAVIPSLNLFDTSVARQLSLLHTKAYIIEEPRRAARSAAFPDPLPRAAGNGPGPGQPGERQGFY